MKKQKNIVICLDSDELKKHTLETALAACAELKDIQTLDVKDFSQKFFNKDIAVATHTIYQENFEIDR